MKTLTALLTITLAANAYSVGEEPPPKEEPNGTDDPSSVVNTNDNSLVGIQNQEQTLEGGTQTTRIGSTKTGDLTNNIRISEEHSSKLTIRKTSPTLSETEVFSPLSCSF